MSLSNKRAIWQTIQIAEEIKVMKCEPERIFIEMARGGEKEKKELFQERQDCRNYMLVQMIHAIGCRKLRWGGTRIQ